MGELLLIALGAALVNNLALVELLGAGALIRGPRELERMAALGLATALVLLLALPLARFLDREVLRPLDLPYLGLVTFLATCGAASLVVQALLRRGARNLFAGIPLPLFGVNGAVLGAVLLNTAASRSVTASAFYAAGLGLGFTLALVLFAGLRERLEHCDVPLAFRGPAILFVTAGLLSLAFMAFTGFARL